MSPRTSPSNCAIISLDSFCQGFRARHSWKKITQTYLLLGIGPARDLNNHVQDGLLLVGIEGNVVEGRDGLAILLNVDAVLQGVRSSDLTGGIHGRRHFG